MSARRVVVVGGGVAGIAAAVRLAESGIAVTLLDKRPFLGGRASSFTDHLTGLRLDACQHGTMRCCTALDDLLTRLGVADRIVYHSTLHFLDAAGRRSTIRRSSLPAPLHTAPSFLAFRSLGWRDKLSLARAFLAILRAGDRPEHAHQDAEGWFRRAGVTERAIRQFVEPVLVSACNESLSRIACTHAFKVFRDGFLVNERAYEFGVPSVPLAALYNEPAERFLVQRGGLVRHRAIVERLLLTEGGRPAGALLVSGERVHADAVVLATPFDLLRSLLPAEIVEGLTALRGISEIEWSPIVGVHLWFDRPIEAPDALALLDRRSDWVFRKRGAEWPVAEGSEYLSVVISADRELADLPRERVAQIVADEVRACLPEAGTAQLLRWHVVKERKATFAPRPGVDDLRPPQDVGAPGLAIAGEWTRTGWPSTMESAARSGYLAADVVLRQFGLPAGGLPADLPPSWLARLLAGGPRRVREG